ncbi:unnamed protein product [Acanthoscelides obtectus]|uniref:Uncharacterized protein n=1 Tax=Acanthoscelides obtectus TaxID=200917 RepID=A0A9P0M6B8_ACAOB|nr:unnamed protein product [Acanthoscelides obtectus]CAK1685298.1 hypothetical protein AOBTE_LOCUS35313 [Acanthoscelides obtectus]
MQDPELHHKAHSTEEAQGLSLEELPRRCPSFLSSLGAAFCPGSSSPPSLSGHTYTLTRWCHLAGAYPLMYLQLACMV